jgi:hypothetical protein
VTDPIGPRPKRLFFQLEGDPQEDGLVRANDFLDFFEGLLRVLKNLERSTARGSGEVTYRIASLEAHSAAVEIEIESADELNYRANTIVDRFRAGTVALRSGAIDRFDADADTIRAFKQLLVPLSEHVPAVLIRADATEVVFSAEGEEASRFALESQVSDISVGTFSGFIDAVNVHAEPVFFLYPTVGVPKIRCEFDRTLLDDVRTALKKYVTVHGLMAYRIGNPFPIAITVERFEINPPEHELPTLASLRGLAPRLTQGLSSEEYIRQLRDAGAT